LRKSCDSLRTGATQPSALGEVLRINVVAPFIGGAKAVRHRRKDKLVGTVVVCSWVRLAVLVSMQDGGEDKVGKDSGRCLMEWRGSVVGVTPVSCRVDYTSIGKVLSYTRRRVRHARKISWAGR
jgi:hypothetical protein